MPANGYKVTFIFYFIIWIPKLVAALQCHPNALLSPSESMGLERYNPVSLGAVDL